MADRSNLTLYLLRHGETEWNAEGRFQGKLDSALTGRGIAQAEACGRRLAQIDEKMETLVSSPLGRTRQTTAIIRRFGKLPEPRWDERIAEVSIGSWDGLTAIDIDAHWPGLLDGATAFDWFFRSPDGESYDDAADRVCRWLDDIQGVVVAVSHGLIGRLIRGAYLGLTKHDVMGLPVPQDVIWRMTNGGIEAIPT